jgi:aminopeptidase N
MAQVDLDRDPSQSARSEMAMGTMTTTPLIKKALSEGDLSVRLYTDYYGPVAFKQLALTQQTACTFGQSWPGLVWIPMCYFYDTTVRHQMRMDDDRGYWRAVTPHEVAHQWWGHQVGFVSYRDQWMSEGFAEMSAGLYLQMVEKNPKKFIQFWNEERELVLDHNEKGFRGIDMPITVGYRANNFRSGDNLTRFLIYPKGAYILHMVRMMMWNVKTGDQLFKDTMQDFVRTYGGRAATTEDFKATVEKHMTPEMVALADGKNNMDWFFNEYVYGTELPTYKLDYSFVNGADGKPVFDFKLTQSGVDNTFRMPVPIYFELEDGHTIMLGRVRLTGNTTVSQQVPLGALKPKRAVVNYQDDVLSTPN